jgi:hypothetical protein
MNECIDNHIPLIWYSGTPIVIKLNWICYYGALIRIWYYGAPIWIKCKWIWYNGAPIGINLKRLPFYVWKVKTEVFCHKI